jgi:hypothetical protein
MSRPSSVYNITAQRWIINEIVTALAMAGYLSLSQSPDDSMDSKSAHALPIQQSMRAG